MHVANLKICQKKKIQIDLLSFHVKLWTSSKYCICHGIYVEKNTLR